MQEDKKGLRYKGLSCTRTPQGKKRAGKMVETKGGLIGQIYNDEKLYKGKVKVHTEKGGMLCDPKTLEFKGYFN